MSDNSEVTPRVGDYLVQRGDYGPRLEGPVTKITALSAMVERESARRNRRDKQVPLRTILFSGPKVICIRLHASLRESRDRENYARRQLSEQRIERDEKLIAEARTAITKATGTTP